METLEEALQQLENVKKLKKGWDSYDTAPKRKVIKKVIPFLKHIYSRGWTSLRPSSLGASVEGGIGVSFREGDLYAYIELLNHEKEVSLLLSDGVTEPIVHIEKKFNNRTYDKFSGEIRAFFKNPSNDRCAKCGSVRLKGAWRDDNDDPFKLFCRYCEYEFDAPEEEQQRLKKLKEDYLKTREELEIEIEKIEQYAKEQWEEKVRPLIRKTTAIADDACMGAGEAYEFLAIHDEELDIGEEWLHYWYP